jgi:hypothetical protein
MSTDKERKDKIVSFIVSMSGVLFGAMLAYSMNVSPDFIISLNDIADTVLEGQHFTLIRELSVDNAHLFKPYNYPVTFEVQTINGTYLPKGLNIDLDPGGATRIPLKSNMTISGSNIKRGTYLIKIIAFGGDGKERTCAYKLNVVAFMPD